MSALSAVSVSQKAREYMLAEFKRRHRLSELRRALQAVMAEKHQTLWWCKDEALKEIALQFVESTNHVVIDNFLGEEACSHVRAEVLAAHSSNLLSVEGMLSHQGRVDSIRSDTLGWFDS